MKIFIERLRDDAGEGVISTGIAVLIMAVVGAAMFVAFTATMNNATNSVDTEIKTITD